MDELLEFRRTIAFAEDALAHLRANELPAHPRNFELWYTYASGVNPDLNHTINTLQSEQGALTSRDVARIYDEFVAPYRVGARIEELGEKFSAEIERALTSIAATADSAAIYSDDLTKSRSDLGVAIDRVMVEAVVRKVAAATQRTEDVNRRLATQLEESRRQIIELQQGLEAIRFESLTDELTTLANRKHFDHALLRALAEAEHSRVPFSLIMADIDHFKKFNDTFGHQIGDQVLRLVAIGLKQNVKATDIACRYGGEEFGIILPRTTLTQAVGLAEFLRQVIMSKELVKRSTSKSLGRITVSFGVATWARGDLAAEVLARADAALYAAKRGGRNLVRSEADTSLLFNEQVA